MESEEAVKSISPLAQVLPCFPFLNCVAYFYARKQWKQPILPPVIVWVGKCLLLGSLPCWIWPSLAGSCLWATPAKAKPKIFLQSRAEQAVWNAFHKLHRWAEAGTGVTPQGAQLPHSPKQLSMQKGLGTRAKRGSWCGRNRNVRDRANIEKEGRERARNKGEAAGEEARDRKLQRASQRTQEGLRNCPGARRSAPSCCLLARKIKSSPESLRSFVFLEIFCKRWASSLLIASFYVLSN